MCGGLNNLIWKPLTTLNTQFWTREVILSIRAPVTVQCFSWIELLTNVEGGGWRSELNRAQGVQILHSGTGTPLKKISATGAYQAWQMYVDSCTSDRKHTLLRTNIFVWVAVSAKTLTHAPKTPWGVAPHKVLQHLASYYTSQGISPHKLLHLASYM